MMEARLIFMAIVCLCIAQLAFAIDQNYVFKSQREEQRYVKLIKGVRCSVCQNQSLFESNAEIAAQMRDEIYTMFSNGMNDGEIRLSLRKTYGNRVLFMPPLRTTTILLWLAPVMMLLIGFVVFKNQNPRKNIVSSNYAC